MPQMPSMPSISSPSINKSTTQKNTTETKNSTNNNSTNISAYSLLQMNSANSLGGITDLNSILSELSSENTTEDDLKKISELFNSPLTSLSSTNSTSSNLLLNQILQKLNDIQTQLNSSTTQQTTSSNEESQNANPKENSNGKILRFRINNLDLTTSFTTLFFSDKEEDGSFLLSGDRTYNLYGKSMSETFYMLFKNKDGNNFEVAVAISQNDENQNSFLYRFAKDSPYQGKGAGNLFYVNSNKNNLKVDILIELK